MSDYAREVAEFVGALIVITGVIVKLSKIEKNLKKDQAKFQEELNQKVSSAIKEIESKIQEKINQYGTNADKLQNAKDKDIAKEIADLYRELDRFIKKIAAIDEELTGRDGLYVELEGMKKDIENLKKE